MEFMFFSSCMVLLITLDNGFCIETEGRTALIFDRHNGALVLLPKRVSKTATCGAWATACPATKSAAGDDLMTNGLVVKEIYDRGGKTIDVKMKVCEEPYKIAVAFDIVKLNFRFGFAIYYKMRNEEYFRRSNLKYYMTPKEVTEIMRKYSVRKGKYLRGEGFRIRKAVENDNRIYNDEIWFNGNQKMEFMWINMFSLRFDFFNKILKRITYTIQQTNKWPVGEQCVDYSLALEVYEETNANYVDNLYSETNQQEIFKNMKVPVSECSGTYCPMRRTPCESNRLCLSKWLLIPIDQFSFGYSSTLVCSYMATIPIWTDKVEKVLKKVDQYLFILYKISGQALFITSGVSNDVLQLPSAKIYRKTSEVYLDHTKKKIPVPKIIYKLVKLRFRSDPNSEIYTAWYSALIVIHNDPYHKKGTRICYEDVTIKWGWQEITRNPDGGEFENVYVCEADGNVLRKVMGPWNAAKQPPSRGLNLEKFPSFEKDVGEENIINIKIDIDEEFSSISKFGPSLNSDDKMLKRDEEILPSSEDEDEDTKEEKSEIEIEKE